jgi:hypothetical protein
MSRWPKSAMRQSRQVPRMSAVRRAQSGLGGRDSYRPKLTSQTGMLTKACIVPLLQSPCLLLTAHGRAGLIGPALLFAVALGHGSHSPARLGAIRRWVPRRTSPGYPSQGAKANVKGMEPRSARLDLAQASVGLPKAQGPPIKRSAPERRATRR